MLLIGIEPISPASEASTLSIKLQEPFDELRAEGTGIEPVQAFARRFSRAVHYRSASPPRWRVRSCVLQLQRANNVEIAVTISYVVLLAGIEPAFHPPQGYVLSVEL